MLKFLLVERVIFVDKVHKSSSFSPCLELTIMSLRLTFTADPAVKIPIILEMVYPISWLDSKAEDDPSGRTNREIETKASRVESCTTLNSNLM